MNRPVMLGWTCAGAGAVRACDLAHNVANFYARDEQSSGLAGIPNVGTAAPHPITITTTMSMSKAVLIGGVVP